MKFTTISTKCRNSLSTLKSKLHAEQVTETQLSRTLSLSLILLITIAFVGSSVHSYASSKTSTNWPVDTSLNSASAVLASDSSAANLSTEQVDSNGSSTSATLHSRALVTEPVRRSASAQASTPTVAVPVRLAVARMDGSAAGGTNAERGSLEGSTLTHDEQEILWLARVLNSESHRSHEQYLIGWVVRNRVETGYHGGDTYQEIATQTGQFSGLQSWHPKYSYNISRTYASQGANWRQALEVAREVYYAPASKRPFSRTTRHFYSPHVVDEPQWAVGREPVHMIISADGDTRFAFYAGVR